MSAPHASQRLPAVLVSLLFLAACGGGEGSIAPFSIQSGIAVADLNGDSRPDIVVARTEVSGPPPHPGFVDVYLQTAGGSYAPLVAYPVGSDPWNLAVGDVDGDDLPDIVVANSGSGNLSILLQDQGGTFHPAEHIETGGTPYAVAIGDIDDDGHADLAVALQNTGGGALVLLQDPVPLSFKTPIALLNGTGATSVALGDLNGDSLPDVAANGGTKGISVFYQNATPGTFGPAVSLTAGIRPTFVAIADLDMNGLNDLVVSNAGHEGDGSDASVSVLRQDGPGHFLPRVDYLVANGAQHLAVGQLVGDDAAPDIAVISLVFAAQQASTVSVLQNQPDGSFETVHMLEGPFSANFVAIGDINGDTLPDLVTNDGPRVFLQNANFPGTFNSIPLP